MREPVELVGYASGVAGNNPDCALGPWYMYYHPEWFQSLSVPVNWHTLLPSTAVGSGKEVVSTVEHGLQQLADTILPLAQAHKPICVIGGDHSCGIATWSAVAHANRAQGDMGLIWIDAHMDAHTPETSDSQNIHGMPVAHLLGEGLPSLTQLLDSDAKIKPENLCLIGIRSYQQGEADLLARLGVKIYFMEEVTRRGIQVVLQEAEQLVSRHTCGVGISIDLDAIDPADAPGVGYREPGGIAGHSLVSGLHELAQRHKLLALEVTEYNPLLDDHGKTAQLLVALLHAVYA